MTKTSLVMVQPGTSPVSGATWCACGVMLMCPQIVFHHSFEGQPTNPLNRSRSAHASTSNCSYCRAGSVD